MTLLLRALVGQGAEVDLYATACPASLAEVSGLRVFLEANDDDLVFRRLGDAPLVKFTWGQSKRALGQRRLAGRLLEEHRRRPYDVVYQFSQPELLALRRYLSELPPIVVHPQVHAAGELAWHRREDELARQCESRLRTKAVRGMLIVRSRLQARDLRVVDAVVCPSSVFADAISRDYGVPRDQISVVPSPVDLERFAPMSGPSRRPREIVFVSRFAVRKGVDLVVDLSHRLDDLAAGLRIRVIGDGTMWSDYSPLLRSLNPRTSEFAGYVEPKSLAAVLGGASLLVQPSQYEPFALTVAESLACGTPVVVSDQVGAGEWLDAGSSAVFPAGDRDAFEAAVRSMLARLDESEATLRQRCRETAEREFAPAKVAGQLREVIEEVVARGPRRTRAARGAR